jgi:hypothetical protein
MKLQICPHCSAVGEPQYKGSPAIEIIMWLLCLLPGVFYTIWRLSSQRICHKCRNAGLIPLDTPHGQALYKKAKGEI